MCTCIQETEEAKSVRYPRAGAVKLDGCEWPDVGARAKLYTLRPWAICADLNFYVFVVSTYYFPDLSTRKNSNHLMEREITTRL